MQTGINDKLMAFFKDIHTGPDTLMNALEVADNCD